MAFPSYFRTIRFPPSQEYSATMSARNTALAWITRGLCVFGTSSLPRSGLQMLQRRSTAPSGRIPQSERPPSSAQVLLASPAHGTLPSTGRGWSCSISVRAPVVCLHTSFLHSALHEKTLLQTLPDLQSSALSFVSMQIFVRLKNSAHRVRHHLHRDRRTQGQRPYAQREGRARDTRPRFPRRLHA